MTPPNSDATPRNAAAARLSQAEQDRAEQARAAKVAKRDLLASRAQAARLAAERARQAAALRATDAQVIAAAARLASAKAAQAAAETALAQREAAFRALIPLMLRLSRTPLETALAAPDGRALEGLLIAKGLATGLNREAALLRRQQDEAARLGRETARQADALVAERTAQAEREAALDHVVTQADAQVTEAEAAGRSAALAIAQAAAQAKTLREAIAAMDAAQARAVAQAEREATLAQRQRRPQAVGAARARQAALSRPGGPEATRFESVKAGSVKVGARLVTPVAGSVQMRFGAPAADGPATGITFTALPGASVVSPCAGRVAFAAPFRSYGQLIIVECGGGVDAVLAGLGRLETSPGHAVRPGEKLGRMAEGPAGKASSGLYLELRARGQPVDPAPFLNGGV